MNGLLKLVVCSFLVVNSSVEACKFVGQASKGFVAGAAATVLVDMGKPYAVDFMQQHGIDIIKLSEKYNLNTERITSDVTNGVAILGVSAVDKLWCGKKGVGLVSLSARLAGIFCGSATARSLVKVQDQTTMSKSTVAAR